MATQHITAKELHQVLEYNPETGVFIWRERLTNRVNVGDVAGSRTHGYVEISIHNRSYRAHHLAWLYVHGVLPSTGIIDHIDGCKDNNRISNLREASPSQNSQNMREAKNGSKSGLMGATWHSQRGKWMAQIRANGKNINLGLFDSAEDAHRAYLMAKKKLHEFGEVAKQASDIAPQRRKPCQCSVSKETGVYFDKRRGTWYARAIVGGKPINLGTFRTKEDARDRRAAFLRGKEKASAF